jgi:hypothetical protein
MIARKQGRMEIACLTCHPKMIQRLEDIKYPQDEASKTEGI